MSPQPAVAGRPGLARHLPEPARFWIAYAPRSWRLAESPWTDLAGASLRALRRPAGQAAAVGLPDLDARDLDDLFCIPPVPRHLAAARDRWATDLVESGTPVLIQLEPGEETEVPEAQVVYDLSGPLLAGDLDRLSSLPRGSTSVWPLISGLTDAPEMAERGCALLAAVGARCVQPLAVELSSADRRELAEARGEEVFDALFHGGTPSERQLARCAARQGLEVFTPRRAGGATPRRRRNRRLAGELALAGELWLRLGHSVSGGQGLFRAARGAETTERDLAGLAREGNLDVLDWFDAVSVEVVREIVGEGESALLASLLEEYLAD